MKEASGVHFRWFRQMTFEGLLFWIRAMQEEISRSVLREHEEVASHSIVLPGQPAFVVERIPLDLFFLPVPKASLNSKPSHICA